MSAARDQGLPRAASPGPMGPPGSGGPARRFTRADGAARVRRARAPSILCDAGTRRAAAARVRFEDLAPIVVKGKAEAIEVYRPLGRAAAREAGTTAVAIGRAREASAIDALLAGAQEEPSRGGTIVLEGDPGMGKSVLVAGAMARAPEPSRMRVLRGAASDVERTTPYFAWRPVFGALFGLSEHTESRASWSGVLDTMARDRELSDLAAPERGARVEPAGQRAHRADVRRGASGQHTAAPCSGALFRSRRKRSARPGSGVPSTFAIPRSCVQVPPFAPRVALRRQAASITPDLRAANQANRHGFDIGVVHRGNRVICKP